MEQIRKMTQGEEIIKYLTEHETLTRLEAATKLHIFELAARIVELKKKGYHITSTRGRSVNQYGRVSHFNIYKLEEK